MIKFSFLISTSVLAIFNKIEMPSDVMEMSGKQMVKNLQYPYLEYDIVTEDGYRLTLNRIPGPRYSKPIDALQACKTKNKKSVLVFHGIASSATGLIVQ